MSAYGLFFVRFDVAALEFRSEIQLLCSSFRRSSKFRVSAAPADAAPLHADAAHLQLIAAPMHFREKRGNDVVEKWWRGERQYLVNLSEW